jgi:hypothetical protein
LDAITKHGHGIVCGIVAFRLRYAGDQQCLVAVGKSRHPADNGLEAFRAAAPGNGLTGAGVSQNASSTSSSVITAGINPVITSGEPGQGSYSTSLAGANNPLGNDFNANTYTNDLAIQQIAGQLSGEITGDAAAYLAKNDSGFDEGGLDHTALNAAGAALAAAIGGGNAGAAVFGTAAGDVAAAASYETVKAIFPNDPGAANLVLNAIASAAGAAGGLAAGGGASGLDALGGAGAAALTNLYNMQQHGLVPLSPFYSTEKVEEEEEEGFDQTEAIVLAEADQALGIGAAEVGNAIGTAGARNALVPYYPANDGFADDQEFDYLLPGTVLGRYGTSYGSYLTDAGTPAQALSLPYGTNTSLYNEYVVQKPLPVMSGQAAPAFGQLGGGNQYYAYPFTIQDLLDQGFLK